MVFHEVHITLDEMVTVFYMYKSKRWQYDSCGVRGPLAGAGGPFEIFFTNNCKVCVVISRISHKLSLVTRQ